MNGTPLIEIRGIAKSYAAVRALDHVSLSILPGEIHALVGENGAGKSTLIRILSGVAQPDGGEILWEGRPVRLDDPRAARRLGIAAAFQDPELFPWRSAAENLFAGGRMPGGAWISWRAATDAARAALEPLAGASIDPRRPAGLLSASERQLLAVAGALFSRPRLLILDEPTAALGEEESRRLFRLLAEHRERGGSVLYVSHRLEEVLAISSRISILKDGRLVRTVESASVDAAALVEAMVGRELAASRPRPPEPGEDEILLAAEGLADPDGAFRGIDLALRRGEILGLYGLVGAGRSELALALAGLRPSLGRRRVAGKVHYLPEERLREGNLPGLSLRENISVSALGRVSSGPWVRRRRERALAEELHARLAVRSAGIESEIGSLSGGNQQKALLARGLATEPEVLLLDEPTQGIDVGARAEVHQIIGELARGGKAILLVSSDLNEVLALSHRVAVMREGRIARILPASEASEEAVAHAAFPLHRPRGDAGRAGERASENKSGRAGRLGRLLAQREAALLLAIFLVAAATGLRSHAFLTLASLRDAAADGAALTLGSLGATVAIAAGALDISIGSILALAAAIAGAHAAAGGSFAGAVAIAVGLGAALGSLNAGLALLARLPPLVISLGALGIYRSLFLISIRSSGSWIEMPTPFRALAKEGPLGIPVTVWTAGLVLLAAHAFLRWSRTGRALLSLGDNPRAARAHGLPVKRLLWLALSILGGLSGLAGLLHAARFGNIQSSLGEGWELQAIAAAVLGGAHISGGRGTVPGALLGATLVQLLQEARSVWGIQERWQLVAVGGLMLLALALERALAALGRQGKWSSTIQ